jgi:hypothetical protein
MVGSRLLAGLWTLHRWTRAADEVTCPEWLAAFERVRWSVGDSDSVRLLVSGEVNSPLSWGWRRPVVLIDTDTLGRPDDAEAILAHELAHVARRDWPALMLSRIAATLFWFNPLVWMLERETVQQAEEAADCEAAGRIEPARYAETLLNWAQSNPLLPANSIAPSGHALGRRVKAVLDRSVRERPSGSAWTAAAILLCFGIAAPVAAMQLVAAQPPEMPVRARGFGAAGRTGSAGTAGGPLCRRDPRRDPGRRAAGRSGAGRGRGRSRDDRASAARGQGRDAAGECQPVRDIAGDARGAPAAGSSQGRFAPPDPPCHARGAARRPRRAPNRQRLDGTWRRRNGERCPKHGVERTHDGGGSIAARRPSPSRARHRPGPGARRDRDL